MADAPQDIPLSVHGREDDPGKRAMEAYSDGGDGGGCHYAERRWLDLGRI